jgi:hypothetical protein
MLSSFVMVRRKFVVDAVLGVQFDISEMLTRWKDEGENLFLSRRSPGNTRRSGGRKLNRARLLMSNGLCL